MSKFSRFAYCIDCEANYPIELSIFGDECHEHFVGFDDNGQQEWDWCFFPLGYLDEEPRYPENWDELVEVPSPEELEMMDRTGEELLLDLIG